MKKGRNWLQLYVDAMTEKDPYKRLALVRELRELPRADESDDLFEAVSENESPGAYSCRQPEKHKKNVMRRSQAGRSGQMKRS
jgi:hypothetical protein